MVLGYVTGIYFFSFSFPSSLYLSALSIWPPLLPYLTTASSPNTESPRPTRASLGCICPLPLNAGRLFPSIPSNQPSLSISLGPILPLPLSWWYLCSFRVGPSAQWAPTMSMANIKPCHWLLLAWVSSSLTGEGGGP